MNKFEESLVHTMGEENLKKLQGEKIGIAGAGGLGSNCACNLTRCGFKNFVICDYDKIQYSNLNRQFFFYNQAGKHKVEALNENLKAINPDINVEILSIKITKKNIKKIFRNCSAVIEAFDDAKYKSMIAETYANSDKLLVCASGIAGWGRSDEIKVKKINETFFVVGDLVSEASISVPPISPRVNIASAKQADVVLNYFLNKNEVNLVE